MGRQKAAPAAAAPQGPSGAAPPRSLHKMAARRGRGSGSEATKWRRAESGGKDRRGAVWAQRRALILWESPSGGRRKRCGWNLTFFLFPPPTRPFLFGALAKGCENSQKCAFFFGHGGVPGFSLHLISPPLPQLYPLLFFFPSQLRGFGPVLRFPHAPHPSSHTLPRWVVLCLILRFSTAFLLRRG